MIQKEQEKMTMKKRWYFGTMFMSLLRQFNIPDEWVNENRDNELFVTFPNGDQIFVKDDIDCKTAYLEFDKEPSGKALRFYMIGYPEIFVDIPMDELAKRRWKCLDRAKDRLDDLARNAGLKFDEQNLGSEIVGE